MAITHTTVVATPDDGTSDVGTDEWNAPHTVANDTITYAMIQNVSATNRLLGRSTAGAGDIEEIMCSAAGRALLDDATAADQRTTLGLGTAAVEDTTAFDAAGAAATVAADLVTHEADVTTHGITAFGATLVDDADASAARTTLGLAAVASSGSASDLGSGTLPIARIADGDVSLAKLANLATQRVVGRNTAGTGVPEAVTASQLFDWVSNTNGVLLTRTGGSWAALANVTTNDGNVELAHDTAPATPAAGKTGIHGHAIATRAMAAQIDPNARIHAFQPFLARTHVGIWLAPGGNTLPLAFGILAPTTTGTATSATMASTNLFTSTRRLHYVSASSAGSVAGPRATIAQFWRGNAANLGGWFAAFRWGVGDGVTTANMFVGLQANVNAPTNVAPSTFAEIVGIGCDTGDTNLQLYASDATPRARTDLGANFPCNTNTLDVYEFIMFCPPNASAIDWTLNRLNTGNTTSGQITGTNLPTATTFLTQQMWRTNGVTASAVTLAFFGLYVETEY